MKSPARKNKQSSWYRFHLIMMFTWGALTIPTLLWWKTSILWVALLSLYANWVGHFGAWQAARAEQAANEVTGE